ncbi:MAG: EamA family transporter [Candidatus Doudnabacteria bacterium]|nr:EamA family transporter [Candidatus Doudnabacteria bacterium]
MSLYITIAISAYLLFAFNGIADKFLLTKAVKHPVTYAFYSSAGSVLILALAPFFLEAISWSTFYIAIVAGACFSFALYFLYDATQDTSISRILPIEGGLVPVFTLVLSYLLLAERLNNTQLSAFFFLVMGAIMISFRHERDGWHITALKNATIAAVLFALSFVLTKYVYLETSFLSGLVWTRMGLVVGALSFLLIKQFRKVIFAAPEKTSGQNKLIFYGARVSGGLGGFLQNYAISLGSVTIVNALQGTQFVFLLIMTSILSIYFPQIIKEKISRLILLIKIVAMLLITFGLTVLTV